jgi:ABC-2 type transport system permease protein
MADLMAQPDVPAPAKRVRAVPPATRRSGLPGTLRSEFTKIRSVRSTWLTLAAFVAGGLLIGIAATASNRQNAGQSSFDPTLNSLAGTVYFGELVIVVTGALVITSEYGTRMIGTSLAAMPRRGVLYAAKAIALACVTLAVALATSFASFFIGQAVLASTHAGTSITSPGALRSVLFAALFVTC